MAKALKEFPKERQNRDGRSGRCKECKKRRLAELETPEKRERKRKQAVAYVHRHPEKFARSVRRWQRASPEKIREYNRKTHRKHPEKEKARQALRYAVRAGKIIKPTSCSDCGEPVEKHRLEAHHPDYERPYEVEWLCHGCHNARHWD